MVPIIKRLTHPLLLALFTCCFGVLISWSYFRLERSTVKQSWKTYINEEHGYRLRHPEGWTLWDRGTLYLCSPRINFPCGPTPHEVYATVAVEIRNSEGVSLTDYLRSPARAYKDLRELRVAGVQAFATGPVDDHSGRNLYDRFIDEQVHFAHGGKVYTIISYTVDSSRKEFEEILMSFEFLK
jgi:hypothetical protein